MSQKVTRKPVPEEKDKNQKADNSPLIEVKKKPNQAAQVNTEKPVEKPENKAKTAEKTVEKGKPAEKSVDTTENKAKPADKAVEKAGEKSGEKNGVDKDDKKDGQEKEKADNNAKQNGSKSNGSSTPQPNPNINGNGSNNIVEIDSSTDDEFPELTYDESDVEPAMSGWGRSATRRDQVKASRTPETPRPASVKDIDNNVTKAANVTSKSPDDDATSKDKVLQMKDGVATDRKLRSTDSPKPEAKKPETPKKETAKRETPKKDKKDEVKENGKEIEIVVEIEGDDEPEQRKTDTNFSKSRVKVSPYRRSGRLADQTTSSVQANYTGNNTTMEMDITESSFAATEPSLDDSGYLHTIRNMRGRRSYKLLKDINITHNRSLRSNANTPVSESSARPTAPVVGRKRKPEQDEGVDVEVAVEAGESPVVHTQTKRMRLLDRIAQPFRRTSATAEIVGVNTDLPLTAPVAAPSMDPETLKSAPVAVPINPSTSAAPAADGKRCIIM